MNEPITLIRMGHVTIVLKDASAAEGAAAWVPHVCEIAIQGGHASGIEAVTAAVIHEAVQQGGALPLIYKKFFPQEGMPSIEIHERGSLGDADHRLELWYWNNGRTSATKQISWQG